MIEHVVIMAAGKGTRMLPITNYIPKAMVLHKNKTLIEKSINFFKSKNLKVHVTVGHKSEILAPHLLCNNVNSIINTNGKDNSWWIYNSLIKNIDSPILVTTCDSIIDIDLDVLFEDYMRLNSPSCLIIPTKATESIEGDFIIKKEDGSILSIGRDEKTDLYCSGMQIINPKKINEKTTPVENFKFVWDQLISMGDIYCSEIYPSYWRSIDDLSQLKELNNE